MLIEGLVAGGTRGLRGGYERRDTQASLGMGVISMLWTAGADALIVLATGALVQLAPWRVPEDTWWGWALAFVAVDLCFYWIHRFHHEVRFMWAGHVNHHSSQHYNLSTALRQSWTEHYTSIPFFMVLGLLGFSPLLITVSFAFNLLYQFIVHTERVRTLGPLEWVLNSPSHHRVHHGSNPRYLDRNYAGVFIVWDRLFGTFEPETEPVRYGLVKDIESFNLLHIAFHEWAAMFRAVRGAGSARERWHAVFGRPGWHPQGATLTAPELRAQALAQGPTSSQ
ncbi:MAG: sterol desaturase family protein [Myxococcales bacterium]|nr:sterol desaturase family protein [Myxococcales bacterium]MCB9523026.1 sterol desaturase family protein [Myxococcales bacterium]